jgi:hypothetical protein
MKELINTFKEEYTGAKEESQKNRLKNSLILYSKSLFALCDIIIFKKFEKLPKNHSERFRILEENFPLIYEIVDKIWSDYRDTYSKSSNKESIESIKDGIKKISETEGAPEEIKKIIG